MGEFTSTGLVSLLVKKLEDADPELLVGISKPDPMKHAIEPDGLKRQLVELVMKKHGPGLLMSVGQSLPVPDEFPVLEILVRSGAPDILAQKWMRLERYFHASHRTEISTVGLHSLSCNRTSTAEPATLGENALIAGLLLGLVGAMGCEECYLQCGDQVIKPADLPDVSLAPDDNLQTFTILWSPRDDIEWKEAEGASEVSSATDMAEKLADLLSDDIGRSWRLCDAAKALGLSQRSLQRYLTAQGRTFSTVLRRARMRQATQLLTRSNVPLSEIGYCCGYADQAHFQRDFLRATNITPRVFRQMV